jgi:hypothetical protein
LQHNEIVRLVPFLALVPGCLYFDPVNQRPSIDIIQQSSQVVPRGGTVALDAEADDPEGQAVWFQWHVYACADATAAVGCDADPFFTSLDASIQFPVPLVRDGGSPVQSVRVQLDAVDSLGATAKPSQELVIAVSDAAPVVMLRADSAYGYVIGAPVVVYATVSDADDPSIAPLDWTVFGPVGPSFTPDPVDPMNPDTARTFVPTATGPWTVRVTATDPVGETDVESVTPTIVADSPPCLAQTAPIAAPPGQAWPMTDATLFQVLVVQDDLDRYPTNPSDPILGAPTFTWSLLPPGATTRHVMTGATGASVALDPASYTPGDLLELRVEIADRNHTPIPCAEAAPTCSIGADSCIQRLTWRVEVL